jgi:ribosomal protein S18 acetylase RimI-like enzyme
MNLRYATENDIPLLAEFNHQLIEDERAPNPMTVRELARRMAGWFEADYRAVVFETNSTPVAYALFRDAENGIYLRQFYVAREHRRSGIGTSAIRLFRERVVPTDRSLSLEVLSHNEVGIAFWRAVGFHEHAISFRIDPSHG